MVNRNIEAEYWKKQYRILVFGILIMVIIFLFLMYLQNCNKKEQKEFNQDKIQNLCIGWANHKVLEKKSYSNSFGGNILQQKYWIEVYQNCMEDYNG